jgi:hypothetical protein
LELLSQKHRCRICVYSLTPDFYLSELVVNNNHPRSTQLSKVLNHYDPVYTQESLELANEFKDMIVEVVLGASLEATTMVQQGLTTTARGAETTYQAEA